MKAKFRCPQCAQTIKIGPEAMGKRGKCPGCQEVIKIPTAEQFAAAAKTKQAKAKPVPVPAEPAPLEDEFSSSTDAWDDFDLNEADVSQSGSTTLAPPPNKGTKATKAPAGKRTWRMFGTMVLGIVLMVATLPVTLMCWRVASQISASNAWPDVPGQITTSHVTQRGFGRKKKYHAEVNYLFTVGGRTHHGSNVAFGSMTGSSYSAQQGIVDKYPPGSRVDVYYDPDSPDQCVLEPGGWPIKMAIPPVITGGLGWIFFATSTGRMKA